MIWGMTLHSGQEFTRKVFGEERLTLASLECRTSKYEGKQRPSACLLLKTERIENVICTLEKGVTNQQYLDLIFEQEEEITFQVEGTGIIYLTGYTTEQQDEQNERQEDPATDVVITVEENKGEDCDNIDEMPDNQGSSNQGGKVHIKQENDDENVAWDSEEGQEELDDGPSTTGNSQILWPNIKCIYTGNLEPVNDGNMKGHDNGGRVQGKVTNGNGCIDGSHPQSSTDDHEEDTVSGDNVGCHSDDRDFNNDGNDRDLHGDDIQGNGNSCDYADNPEVHLRLAGVPSDKDSVYGRVSDEFMGNHGMEEGSYSKGTATVIKTSFGARIREIVHADEKPYKCTYCEKKFKTIYSAKRHESIHTSEGLYKCQVCPKRYRTKGYLEVHMRSHTGERPFQCHMCKTSFSTTSARNRHIRKHGTTFRYQCQKCGKGFSSEKKLRAHEKLHTEKPKYHCLYCNLAFVRIYHRNRHEMTAHF